MNPPQPPDPIVVTYELYVVDHPSPQNSRSPCPAMMYPQNINVYGLLESSPPGNNDKKNTFLYLISARFVADKNRLSSVTCFCGFPEDLQKDFSKIGQN